MRTIIAPAGDAKPSKAFNYFFCFVSVQPSNLLILTRPEKVSGDLLSLFLSTVNRESMSSNTKIDPSGI